MSDLSIAGRQSAVLGSATSTGRPRVVLVQTQAEGAGAQEISRILGRGLERRGFDVHHLFFYRRTGAFDRQPNTAYCAGERPGGPAAIARMFGALVGNMRRLKPDAAICFQHYGNAFGAPAARLAGAKLVIANRNSSRVLEPRWTQWADRAFGTAGLFSNVVVNSAAVADEYAGHPAAYRSRLVRIDHGFEAKLSRLDSSAARRTLGLPQGITLLGSVGRLHPLKNHGAAVKLLAADPSWHLAIAGQGTERANLEALAASLGVSGRLHLVGELSPMGVADFLRALDLFVFPSLAETFGLAVVEAAAAGVPVVAHSLPVLREVLAVGGKPCAVFTDATNEAAFAQSVCGLLADRAMRTALAASGMRLPERYGEDEMVSRYAALLTNGLAQRAAA